MKDLKLELNDRTRYKIKKTTTSVLLSVLRYAFLIIVGYIVLYPLLYMLVAAFKTEADFLDVSHQWIPMEYTVEHFSQAIKAMSFWTALGKTFELQMVSAGLEIFVCAFVAYGFARFNFPFKKIASFLLILSLLVPLQMYSLGLAVNYRILHIFNTPFSYWFPALFGVGIRSGMLIYIYQQFFIGLPLELEEAAYVDGAGPVRTYFSIALPSSSVVVVTVSVLSIIWHWNESYLARMCFMDENRPLSVMMSNIGTLFTMYCKINSGEPIYPAAISCACLLFLAIPLVFYMIIQRNFIKSIDRVGITG